MEVVIKNTKNSSKKAIVFGFNYTLYNTKPNPPYFFDLSTDDGVEIFYDGDSSFEYKKTLMDTIGSNPIKIESIEFTSNKTNNANFYYSVIDANGKMMFFNPKIPQLYVRIHQDSIYPIIIKDKEIKGIDNNTFLLFTLQPNEEIKLKLIK